MTSNTSNTSSDELCEKVPKSSLKRKLSPSADEEDTSKKTGKQKLLEEFNVSKDDSPQETSKCYDKNADTSRETKAVDLKEHSSIVAQHYNHIEEKGLKERIKSPIIYLRNFNNWIKSVLIQEHIEKLREKDYGRPIRVLDICCGKGGDINKWQKARVEHVVFADIAEVSVEQCKARYNDQKRHNQRLFSAEFISVDCSKSTLRDKYKDPSINFDLVSCQFGLHYSFESYEQANRMLNNISECLKAGGYFIGTIPNAYEIIKRASKTDNNEFSNRVYNIKLLFNPLEEGFPLFGGKYHFHLEGVVDCPEFLVNFELLVKLAAKYGLELVYKSSFGDFYKENCEKYKQLVNRIACFEGYPPPPGKELIGEPSDYTHAKEFLDNYKQKNEHDRIGTMSKSEWEVATVYMAFAFKKCKSTWDENGKPVYHM